MSSPTLATPADLDAAAIADAATRLAMVRRLADLAMRLAEEICERAINSPYHPEPVHEPARAFATISRAVRLTLVLQERMEAKLIALRKGEAAPLEKPSSTRPTTRSSAARDDTPDDDAPETSDRLRESLREREGERFDEMVSGPFDDGVAAVGAHLGLRPDEDIPSDENGVESALEAVLAQAATTPPSHGAPRSVALPTPARSSTPHSPDSG